MQEFTGRQYLAIDIANNFGLDKKTWNERLDWFVANEPKLKELVVEAETPALMYAGIQAYEAVKAGEPIGYPISLDATFSGLQILSVLTGDRSAAQICNVVPTGQRNDAYTIGYDEMLNIVAESPKLKRDNVKNGMMTSFYGSEAEPKKEFGEGVLLQAFYQVMQYIAPACWELNQAFLDMWDSTVLKHSWIMPDNFHVHVKVMGTEIEPIHFLNEKFDTVRRVNKAKEKGRSLCANVTHGTDGFITRELGRRCDYNMEQIQEIRRIIFTELDQPDYVEESENTRMTLTLWELYEKSGYLSARIFDYIDQDTIWLIDRVVLLELIESLPDRPFKIITVHDCFRCLPNYGNDLRKQYNRQLYLIAKSNMLSFLLSQILGREINVEKLDPTLADDILETDYALS